MAAAAACVTRSASRSTSTACSAPALQHRFAPARGRSARRAGHHDPLPTEVPWTGQPYYPSGCGLSVLDQSPIAEGATNADALANTLDLARLADELGYHRYWLAEHHGGPMLAGPAPEVLIGPVAAATARIRVGQRRRDAAALQPVQGRGGVHACSPAMYPGRIDLGLGRARRAPTRCTTFALQRDRSQRDARRLPPAARRAARLPRRTRCPRTTRSRALTELPAEQRPEVVAAGLLAAVADLGRRGGLPLRVRRLHQPRRRRRRLRAGPARRGRPRLGRVRRDRGGGAAAGVVEPDDVQPAAPRPADPGAAAGEGAALPGGVRLANAARAARRRSATPTRCAPASRRSRRPTAPTR